MIRMKPRLLAVAALAACAFAPAAQALPQLELSDGITTVTITDGGAGDISGEAGVIVFHGAVGAFTINVTTGITKPVLGSASQPVLDLNSIDVTGTTGATLTIKFSETDFISTGSSVNFLAAVGGVTAGTVSFDYFASETNTIFATDLSVSSSGPMTGPFLYSDLGSEALSGLYSLTTVATIVHTGGSQNSSFNSVFETVTQTIDIPEAPFAPSLLIGALLLAGRTLARRHAIRA